MRKDVWFPVLFLLSLCLMLFPSLILFIIIQASLFPPRGMNWTDISNQEACNASELGYEFNLLFMENDNSSFGFTYVLDVYPIPRYSRDVKVVVNWSSILTGNNTSRVETVITPDEHKVIEVPNSLQLSKLEKSMKGITITASDKIGVYGMNKHLSTCDGFLVLPDHLLGKDHYVVCFFPQDRKTQVAFVATTDDTHVNFTLRSKTRPILRITWEGIEYWSGDNISFNLVKGEAIQIQADTDLTGCGVHSDKPIAVFAGNDLTRAADDLFASVDVNFTWAENHLVEQIPDVSHWGRRFYLVPFIFKFDSSSSSPGYLIKFVCSKENTSVDLYFNSGNTSSFYCSVPGDYFKSFVRDYEGLSIRANKPILVAQIFASSVDLSPSMGLITPEEKFNSYYVFPTPKSNDKGSFFHFLQITVNSSDTSDLLLDNKELPSTINWKMFNDGSNFMWTTFEISEGIHTLNHKNNHQFGASIVGHSKMPRFCSYAYPAGLCS